MGSKKTTYTHKCSNGCGAKIIKNPEARFAALTIWCRLCNSAALFVPLNVEEEIKEMDPKECCGVRKKDELMQVYHLLAYSSISGKIYIDKNETATSVKAAERKLIRQLTDKQNDDEGLVIKVTAIG